MIPLYVGIGERGKQLALAGRHVDALQHYREAMHRAAADQAPELFLRHFMQCALESLERMGAYDEVLSTCERARQHYLAHPPQSDIARKDCASLVEREGVILLRKSLRNEAMARFAEAIDVAKPLGMPLATTLHGWLRSNLHVTVDRLERELCRRGYWSVSAESVRSDWAESVMSREQPETKDQTSHA